MQNINKKLASLVLAGILGIFGSATVYAADAAANMKAADENTDIGKNAARIKAATEGALKACKEALPHAKAGHKDETAAALKDARTAAKGIFGDLVGMLTQKMTSDIKSAIKANEAGDFPKTIELITDAIAKLEEIKSKNLD